MLTVVAVTFPVVPVWPTALTQSPTARAEDDVDCAVEYVVDFAVVIFSFWDLVLDFLALVLFVALPRLNRVPDTETDVPLTAVTLPLAMAMLSPGKDLPPELPPPNPPGGRLPAPRNPPEPPGVPPAPPTPLDPVVHFPDDEG
jgi:hypothetical protein